MHISLAWWNTSLSPLGKPRATEDQMATAIEVVRYLTKTLQVDCLALGEITADDLNYFVTQIELGDYEFHDGTLKTGRLQFDTGVLYRKRTLRLIHFTSVVASRGSRTLKVAHRLDFLPPNTDRPIHLLVSHWPSRLWCEKNGADRHLLGVRLRDVVEELNRHYGEPAHTILLGDYNDEPYDESLAEQLLATRDRRLLSKNPSLLYNPFWRLLGEVFPHLPGTPCRGYSGSCFFSKGPDTHWRTFDQIIFSAAFLGRSEWQLNEEYTKILQIEPFDSSVCSTTDIFDHFPVYSVIEREEKNG